MRALIVLAGIAALAVSGFAADAHRNAGKPVVVASADVKEVKKASKSAKTEAPARVWTGKLSCCGPQ